MGTMGDFMLDDLGSVALTERFSAGYDRIMITPELSVK
jgi:hypothetical protein